ncbi:Pkinase-domain-containing protein [Meredithblackwellia eburnea MCA 4105]
MVVNKSSGASSTHTAKDKGEKGEKKSVFGKLFERGNVSSNSLQAGNGGGSVSGNSGNGDEGHHHKTGGGEGGAPLGRKPSRKEEKDRKAEEKREKKEAEKLLRVPSGKGEERKDNKDKTAGEEKSAGVRSRSSSKGEGGDGGGGGGVFGDFLKRKTSVTSKRSDDGKSERGGSQAGESHYSGNGGGGGGSKGGQTTASLLKKYGVCEKVAIGKGATATVKLAHKWDRSTERLYAVKEFRKRRKNETEKEYVKKLTSEFCISSTLHHQNIVETVDLVQDEQNHWCEVMEYCPGGDLYAAIKKGSMTTEEINSYFKQILSGVTYLHSMGVAHRDIKPENLLLDARGHVKITDFGVSDVFRMCWEKTTHLSKGLCGSEPYIAPEQFEQKEYDARQVDVWACAVVFYCMHFQELPWRVAKPSDPSFGPYIQLYSASAPAPAPLSNLVPRECRQVIKRMLDPDPKTRMTTEMIANDPWFRSIVVVPPLEGLPVPAAAVTPAAHAQ